MYVRTYRMYVCMYVEYVCSSRQCRDGCLLLFFILFYFFLFYFQGAGYQISESHRDDPELIHVALVAAQRRCSGGRGGGVLYLLYLSKWVWDFIPLYSISCSPGAKNKSEPAAAITCFRQVHTYLTCFTLLTYFSHIYI